jgi:hypothetical protein
MFSSTTQLTGPDPIVVKLLIKGVMKLKDLSDKSAWDQQQVAKDHFV